MFKRGDKVVVSKENVKAIVLGYSTNFSNLVYILPEDNDVIGNYSAFENELALLNGKDCYTC